MCRHGIFDACMMNLEEEEEEERIDEGGKKNED
jgi:hypothetical protein